MQMFRYATMLSWIQHTGRRVDGWQLALSAVSKVKVQTLATLRKGIKPAVRGIVFVGILILVPGDAKVGNTQGNRLRI